MATEGRLCPPYAKHREKIVTIERIIIRNYRALRKADVTLGCGTNIIVGNNEAGKSTLLEAINLALKCQLGRRPLAYELHPFLFNTLTVAEFMPVTKLRSLSGRQRS